MYDTDRLFIGCQRCFINRRGSCLSLHKQIIIVVGDMHEMCIIATQTAGTFSALLAERICFFENFNFVLGFGDLFLNR